MYSLVCFVELEKLLDFDTVVNRVVEHYEYILDESFYEVTEAQLICGFETGNPEEKSAIIPAWAFYVTRNIEGEPPFCYELRINALTGDIIMK